MHRAVLFALALTVPAVAQTPPTTVPGAPIASRVVAGTYNVDAGHTQVLFTVNHLGFSQYTGQFVEPTGTLVLDPKNHANDRVEIVFPIAKVRSTVAALDAHLQKADFFDAEKYPTGRFISNKVTVRGSSARIDGALTLRGVTKPVTLNARFIGAGDMPMGPKKLSVGFAATTTIKRSDFGMTYGIPMVSDRVDLVINAAFVMG